MTKFNARQEKFIENMVLGMCQTDAYIEAGYKARNRKVAGCAASRLLENVIISEEIDERRKALYREAANKGANKLIKLIEHSRLDHVILGAIKLAAELVGDDPPKKLQHSGEVKLTLEGIIKTARERREEQDGSSGTR